MVKLIQAEYLKVPVMQGVAEMGKWGDMKVKCFQSLLTSVHTVPRYNYPFVRVESCGEVAQG